MKSLKRLITIGLLLVLAMPACSTRWRDADPQITESELFELLDAVKPSALEAKNTGGSGDLFDSLFASDLATVYFADAPGPLGTVQSVMSFIDFSAFGFTPEFDAYMPENVVVFFVIGQVADESPIQAAMIVGVDDLLDNEKTFEVTSSFESSREIEFTDTSFTAVMDESLVLRSFDVSETYQDDLAGVIQLDVSTFTGGPFGDEEEYIGKFSTLVGFE